VPAVGVGRQAVAGAVVTMREQPVAKLPLKWARRLAELAGGPTHFSTISGARLDFPAGHAELPLPVLQRHSESLGCARADKWELEMAVAAPYSEMTAQAEACNRTGLTISSCANCQGRKGYRDSNDEHGGRSVPGRTRAISRPKRTNA
jgi:hypothetical protein